MRILLISLQGIGNTILTTPAIKYLYQQGNTLDAVISDNGSNRIVESSEMLRNVYIYKEKEGVIKNSLRLKRMIDCNNYEVVYAMYPNGKRENFLSFWLGRKNKGGSKDRTAYWRTLRFLIREKVKLYKEEHDIQGNLRLVGAPPEWQDCRPVVIVPAEIERDIEKLYPSQNKDIMLVLHPSSGKTEKRLSTDSYGYIAKKLINNKDIKVIITGSPLDEPIIESLIKNIGAGAEKYIHNDILYAAGLIKRSDLFLGNDSSLAHIASAFKKPTIAIFGPTDYKRISPYGENSLVVRKGLQCSPCHSFENDYKLKCEHRFPCLSEMDREKIYQILSFVIDRIKRGENISDMDFGWGRDAYDFDTLWSGSIITILHG